jgi:hypothetical protein
MNQKKITLLAEVIATQLTKGAIDQSFSRRINNKILKAEIKQYKRKLDIISLIIVGMAIIAMIILAIIRLAGVVSFDDNWFLIALLPFLLLISVVGLVNYVTTRIRGMKALLEKKLEYESIERQIETLVEHYDVDYNELHRVYFSILALETDYLLHNFLAAITVKNFKPNEKAVFEEKRMFHFLALLLTEQEIDYSWEKITIERQKKLFQQLHDFLREIQSLTRKLKANTKLPQYFHDVIEKINHRVTTYLQRVSNQQNNLSEKVQEVLLLILRKLKGEKIDWLIVGSTALALYGLPIKANDIDIISTKEGTDKIANLFSKELTKSIAFSETEHYRSFFGKLKLREIMIELMAELEYYIPKEKRWESSSAFHNKRSVEFMGFLVPINSLENALQFYKQKGRVKDQERIKILEKELSEDDNK